MAGFTSRVARDPGPHVLVLALSHGNEIAGAVALDRLLADSLMPSRGRLTFGFVNLAAFERFDPRQPTLSRFIDEDINRVWDETDAGRPAPFVGAGAGAGDPPNDRKRRCGAGPALDAVAVGPADAVRRNGERACSGGGHRHAGTGGGATAAMPAGGACWTMPDLPRPRRRSSPTWWRRASIGSPPRWTPCWRPLPACCGTSAWRRAHPALPPPRPRRQRFAEVTKAVTATTSSFAFVQPWRGGDVVPRRNTLIAMDGAAEIRTPYDDCLLVMPSLRPSRGHTAVRLARFVSPP